MKAMKSILFSKNYSIIMIVFSLTLPLAYATTETKGVGGDLNSVTSNLQNSTTTLFISTSTLETLNIVTGPTFGTEIKVRKGKIININTTENSFLFKMASSTVKVFYDATSTFLTGNEEQIQIDDIDTDFMVYVFGYIKSDKTEILASKVVQANKSRFLTLRR